MTQFQKRSYQRMRNRAFACSDQLWEQIQGETKGVISVSAFIRSAIKKELEEWKHGRRKPNSRVVGDFGTVETENQA